MFVTVVIPVRDEAENLKQLLGELSQLARLEKSNDFEVIFIDDCSFDETVSILTNAPIDCPNLTIRVISLDKPSGQAMALRRGFQEASADFIIRMDGDCQDDPRDIQKFLKLAESGSDLVVGLREIRSHSRVLRFASQQFDAWATLLLGSPFHSSVASFVGFKSRLLTDIKWGKRTNRYLVLEMLQNRPRLPSEIFVSHRSRQGGKSKYKVGRKILEGSVSASLYLIGAFAGNRRNLKE